MALLQAPRGTKDIFGQENQKWEQIESIINQFMHVYHIGQMRTPIFEHTEVFIRNNQSSDVVNKEMYTFLDKGERSLTLRPEGTAGLIRAYVENKLFNHPESLAKYYYIGPNFRYERPQKGRTRIHHQFGVEYLGLKHPSIDAEVIFLGVSILAAIGLKQFEVHINTLGDQATRVAYQSALKNHFKDHLPQLCEDCNRRYQQNPLRILDCKVDKDHPAIQSVPSIHDVITKEAKEYFQQVLAYLESLGIDAIIDPKLVRGLDYYTDTVFEVVSTHPDMGSQSTLFGGGRYDGMIASFDGPDQSGFGFGMGMERLLVACESEAVAFDLADTIDCYVMPLDENSFDMAYGIMMICRQNGYSSEMDIRLRSLKAQFKSADRYQAKYLLFIGEQEVVNRQITIKNTHNQEKITIDFDELLATLDQWDQHVCDENCKGHHHE